MPGKLSRCLLRSSFSLKRAAEDPQITVGTIWERCCMFTQFNTQLHVEQCLFFVVVVDVFLKSKTKTKSIP